MIGTIASTTLAVVLFILCVIVHEAAHAYALHQVGFTIKAAGLGLPLWPRLKLKPTARRPYSISVSPWIIAAYVQARDEDEEKIKKLSYWDQAWFSGAGVVANLAVGGMLVGVVLAIQGHIVPAFGWAGMGLLVWWAGRFVTAVMVPVVALGVFGLIIYTTVTTTAQLVTGTGDPQMSGVLGIGKFLTVSTPLDALKVAALMSISLGLINMLPLRPFDGGRICGDLVRRWWGATAERVYTAVSVALALGFLLYIQMLDVAILTTR